jgi:uncharacterized protein (TIGR02996 family)
MNDQTALLRAICENPDDDTVRLAYADWLEEHDDPTRADFIRTQIEFARTSPGDPLYRYVRWRNLAFEKRYTAELRRELPVWPGVDFGNHIRGFVEDLHVAHYRILRQHAGEVFGTFPIRSLRVRHLSEPHLLADMPELRYVRRLNLLRASISAPGFTLEQLGVLLASPHLTNLESLDLDNNVFGDELVGVLENRIGSLPKLRELWLGGNRLTNAGASRLARSPAFDCLHTLDLSWNTLDVHGVRALASAAHLKRLTRVVLRGYGKFSAEVTRLLRDRFSTGAEF